VIAAAIIGAAAPLAAQKFSCPQAASLLLSDSGGRMDLFSATNITLRCPDGAAEVITKLLRQAELNTVRDTLARAAAYNLRNAGMADSLIALAKDSTQSTEKRRFYLGMLTVFADCRVGIDDSPGFESRWSVLGGSGGHACDAGYRQPLSPATRARAHEGIAWMGAHDPDARLRELSRRAAQELIGRLQ
jgi:hypothetical protein